jgi:hypothetical protein
VSEKNQELIDEIRGRVGTVPRGAVIDSLTWATELCSGDTNAVSDIRELVRLEADAARKGVC